MLTKNNQTGDWTVSIFDNKVVGSTLLIGAHLEKVSSDEIPIFSTFDRQRAGEIMSGLQGRGPAYYPDEIQRYAKLGIRRLFTGQFRATTVPVFTRTMSPVFVDIVVNANDSSFAVLVVDQYGTCAKIAIGASFSERP